MILLIGIIVLFIALIVFIVMCAKQTHWLNLVGAFFVFLFAVFFFVLSGMVLETNRNWKEVLEKNHKKLEQQELQLKTAMTGDPTDFQWPNDSLKGLETAAAQQVLGQGRVWRQCTPSPFVPGADASDLTTGSLTINLPPNSPAFKAKLAPDAADGNAENSVSLVYVFLEKPNAAGGYDISSYIGSFFATEPSDDNTQVKLSPSLILPDPANTQQLKQANPEFKTARELVQGGADADTRWAMYDILPVDSYDVFVDSIRAESDDPNLEVTPEMLREKLTNEYMTQKSLRLEGNDEKYNRIINSIVYTNQPETVFNEQADFKPLDDEKWYKVEFKRAFKNESFKVDFESKDDTQKEIALQGQAFDRDGLALLEILKLGEDVTFDQDQFVLLDHLSWEKNPLPFIKAMRDAGEAVVREVIYRRKLNDFDYDFRALVEFNKQLTSDRDHAKQQLDELKVIETDYKSQIATREDSQQKLSNDIKNFETDEKAIGSYKSKLETQLAQERTEIDRYFRLTKELAAKKAELESKLEKMIEEKSRAAEAAAGDAQ